MEELRSILPDARLQTNEVTRCCNLLPAFFLAYQRGGYQSLNMIEIGSSLGLNLLWNQYGYQYRSSLVTEDITKGDLNSPVKICCQLNGPQLPPLPEIVLPHVASCQGIELVPRDLRNERDIRWVRASIWPEELARHQVLDAAIQYALQEGLYLHHGDASDLLPALLAAIPEHQTAVVWSSYAVNQGPVEVKVRIDKAVSEASRRIPIYRIALEFALEQQAGPRLEWSEYQGGKLVHQELLARCSVHGERMTWLSDRKTRL